MIGSLRGHVRGLLALGEADLDVDIVCSRELLPQGHQGRNPALSGFQQA